MAGTMASANDEDDPTVKGNSSSSQARFDKSRVYIFDGGFATHLTTVLDDDGALMSDPLWSCRALQSNPEAVVQTHKDFIVVGGADIIGTNTYQAHSDLFRKHMKFGDPALEPHLLMESAAKLAQKAITASGRKKRGLVAGSIGPYGACLGDGSEYSGDYIDKEGLSEEEMRSKLKAWHLDRLKRLTVGGVDLFAVETMPSVVEALSVLDALQELPGSRCWVSFQVKEGGQTTARGEPLDEAFVRLAKHPGFMNKVLAIGVNCVHPRDVEAILTKFNTVNHWSRWPEVLNYQKVPYVVYPNAGRIYDPVNKCFNNQKCLSFLLENLRTWIGLGANIIGGCCEIGPQDLKQISDRVFLELFDAMEDRAKMEEASRNTHSDLDQIVERLKKPSYDELKKSKKTDTTGGFVKDLEGDGGLGTFSQLHHQVETAILEQEENS